MTERKNVTRKDAERVLAALRKQHNVDAPMWEGFWDGCEPQIVEGWAFFGDPVQWAIVWEDGPFEWAYRFPEGGLDEELTAEVQDIAPGAKVETKAASIPKHLHIEAICSFAVGIYLA